MSSVVGAVMSLAATLVLAAVVFTMVSGFGNESKYDLPPAGFRVTAVDVDGNGNSDRIKVTYLSGPLNVAQADLTIKVFHAATGSDESSSNTTAAPGAWNPGDAIMFDPSGPGEHDVTIAILSNMVLEGTVNIRE